jgi:hypothetical protein
VSATTPVQARRFGLASVRQAYDLAIAGALGALVGLYLYAELVRVEGVYLRDALAGATIGGMLGFFLNAAGPWRDGALLTLARAASWGALAGAAGGAIGLLLGEVVLAGFQGGLAGRAVSWAILGLGIGVSQGLAYRSTQRLVFGLIGGGLGGLIGGFLFEWLRAGLGNDEQSARLSQGPGVVILCAGLGLCLALVEQALRRAWVVVWNGRQEGRSYLLGRKVSRLGLDEHIEIGLFGDPGVARRHAEIEAIGGGYVLHNRDDQGRTKVNGEAVSASKPLADGDRIELGRTILVFRKR